MNMMVSYLALGVIQCSLLASVCSSHGDFRLNRPTYSPQYRRATLIAIYPQSHASDTVAPMNAHTCNGSIVPQDHSAQSVHACS